MRRHLNFAVILLTAIVLLTTASTNAVSVPQAMNYQGRLSNSGGQPLTGTYSLNFTIYDDSTAGGAGHILWQEVHPNVAVNQGLFTVVLGQGSPSVPLTMAAVSGSPRFLEAKVSSDPLSPTRVRIVSVAYSLVTQFADIANIAMNLNLPASDTVESSSVAFVIANNGTGSAAMFRNNNPASTSATLRAVSAGTGEAVFGRQNGCYVAGQFEINNPTCSHAALVGFTNGTGSGVYGWTSGIGSAVRGENYGIGPAGEFVINNPASVMPALSVFTAGTKEAVFARTIGNNPAGNFIIDNPSNNHSALIGETNGGAMGVLGRTYGNGSALKGETHGFGFAGEFVCNNPASNSITLSSYTVGNGPGLFSRTVGFGSAGMFFIDNPQNNMAALHVSTNGTGPAATFDGNIGVGSMDGSSRVDIEGPTGFNQLRLRSSYTPSGSADPNGNIGDVAWDIEYFYVKTPAGWRRASLGGW